MTVSARAEEYCIALLVMSVLMAPYSKRQQTTTKPVTATVTGTIAFAQIFLNIMPLFPERFCCRAVLH